MDQFQFDRVKEQYKAFLRSNYIWIECQLNEISYFEFEDFFEANPDELGKLATQEKYIILGKRAERLFAAYLDASVRYDLIAENIQIQDRKTSIGELDFLLFDKIEQKHKHVELVYKFYLYDESLGNEEILRWIGPNRNDSLIQKFNKLQDKQFPLLYQNQTKKYLDELSISINEIQQEVCFKADLFIPSKYRNKKFEYINSDCIRGYWTNYREFEQLADSNHQYYLPEKQDWILDPSLSKEWFQFSETSHQIETILSNQKSPLCWIKKSDNKFERVFIVNWK